MTSGWSCPSSPSHFDFDLFCCVHSSGQFDLDLFCCCLVHIRTKRFLELQAHVLSFDLAHSHNTPLFYCISHLALSSPGTPLAPYKHLVQFVPHTCPCPHLHHIPISFCLYPTHIPSLHPIISCPCRSLFSTSGEYIEHTA